MAHVNDTTVVDEPHAPFGGFGASGNGTRIGGPVNLDIFTHTRWLTTRPHP
jgi:benzaldehyde dehydrogenase (NAD)